MDIETRYGVDAKRCVYVTGIDSSDTDEDIIETFAKYGKVLKIVREVVLEQELNIVVIVEFSSEAPITSLEQDFPFRTNSAVNTLTSWLVNKLGVTPHCFDKPSACARATDSSSVVIQKTVCSDPLTP